MELKYRCTMHFKSNISIQKDPVDIILEAGDQINVCESREAAVMAGERIHSTKPVDEEYYSVSCEYPSIYCNPMVFGGERYGVVGFKQSELPSEAASEKITYRTFFIYKLG